MLILERRARRFAYVKALDGPCTMVATEREVCLLPLGHPAFATHKASQSFIATTFCIIYPHIIARKTLHSQQMARLTMESPLRAFPLSPTRSAPDVSVQGLVARFNTLQVNDRDEEAQRQIKRLEAALRRAEIAREEAESEAKALRRDIKEMQEERQKDKGSAQERCDEYEVWSGIEASRCLGLRKVADRHTEKVRKGQKRIPDAEAQA